MATPRPSTGNSNRGPPWKRYSRWSNENHRRPGGWVVQIGCGTVPGPKQELVPAGSKALTPSLASGSDASETHSTGPSGLRRAVKFASSRRNDRPFMVSRTSSHFDCAGGS